MSNDKKFLHMCHTKLHSDVKQVSYLLLLILLLIWHFVTMHISCSFWTRVLLVHSPLHDQILLLMRFPPPYCLKLAGWRSDFCQHPVWCCFIFISGCLIYIKKYLYSKSSQVAGHRWSPNLGLMVWYCAAWSTIHLWTWHGFCWSVFFLFLNNTKDNKVATESVLKMDPRCWLDEKMKNHNHSHSCHERWWRTLQNISQREH